MATSSDVLDHHLKCFGESDLAGIMTDYSSDAVLFMPSGPFKGPEAIKSVLNAFLTEFAKPGSSFSLQRRSVEGDYAYILWSGETADNSYELATDKHIGQLARLELPDRNPRSDSWLNSQKHGGCPGLRFLLPGSWGSLLLTLKSRNPNTQVLKTRTWATP